MIYHILIRIVILALMAPQGVIAQTSSVTIAITEIGAHEKSNYEWIEIYNYGSAPVDLTGWKFFEDEINHGITAPSGTLTIPANSYAIIADVADNFLAMRPGFTGIVFDSAWTTLSLAGELIGLKNADGEFVELFTYPEVGKTSLQRHTYDSDEWGDHSTGDSAGQANTFDVPSSDEPLATEDVATTAAPLVLSLAYHDLLITELVVDPLPDEKEWVELFNPGSADIDLDGLVLVEESGKPAALTGTIKPGSYWVYEFSSAKLNNGGDTLTLATAAGVMIDTVAYGSSSDDVLASPKKGQSLARSQSGEWYVSNTITKKASNIISQEVIIEGGDESAVRSQPKKASRSIVFNEVYSNPIGSDRFHEFIELKNTLDTLVIMEGWVLKDNDNVRFVFPKVTLLPNELFVLERRYSNIALDNTGDHLTLLNERKEIVDTLTVPAMLVEHQSYQNIDGVWELTSQPTKGTENMFYPLNTAPVVRAHCPPKILPNEAFICDGSDSYDPLNDPLVFTWRLMTAHGEPVSTSSDDVATFTITEPAAHKLTLAVHDGLHTTEIDVPLEITTPLQIATAGTAAASAPTAPKKSISALPPQTPEPVAPTSEQSTSSAPEAHREPEPLNIAISDERPDRRYQFGTALALIALALGVVLRMRTLTKARAPSRTPAGAQSAHERPPSQFYSLE